MNFCPKCDNIMLVKRKKSRKVLYCPSCGYEDDSLEVNKDEYIIRHVVMHSDRDKTIVLMQSISNDKISEDERDANEDFFKPDMD
ncbi:MAG: hypothetical protein ACTSVI_09720 [Promethearchaeota archaeon]